MLWFGSVVLWFSAVVSWFSSCSTWFRYVIPVVYGECVTTKLDINQVITSFSSSFNWNTKRSWNAHSNIQGIINRRSMISNETHIHP